MYTYYTQCGVSLDKAPTGREYINLLTTTFLTVLCVVALSLLKTSFSALLSDSLELRLSPDLTWLKEDNDWRAAWSSSCAAMTLCLAGRDRTSASSLDRFVISSSTALALQHISSLQLKWTESLSSPRRITVTMDKLVNLNKMLKQL